MLAIMFKYVTTKILLLRQKQEIARQRIPLTQSQSFEPI